MGPTSLCPGSLELTWVFPYLLKGGPHGGPPFLGYEHDPVLVHRRQVLKLEFGRRSFLSVHALVHGFEALGVVGDAIHLQGETPGG